MTSHKFKDAVKQGEEIVEHKEGNIAVLAYHANTEEGTGEVAAQVHKKTPASMYAFKGKRVPSTKITHTHSEDLNAMVKEKETAISIHSYNKKGAYEKGGKEFDYKKTIFVSGQNEELAKKIGKEIEKNLGENYNIETNPDYIPAHLKGMSNHNIVNKFEKGGVQVEMPNSVSRDKGNRSAVASSISEVVNEESNSIKYEKAKDYKQEYDKAA